MDFYCNMGTSLIIKHNGKSLQTDGFWGINNMGSQNVWSLNPTEIILATQSFET